MKDWQQSPRAEFLAALGLETTSPVQWDLLTQALVPPAAGMSPQPDNDRLEFLGDEVVRLLATRFIYERYPDLGVGELTALRAQLVSNQALGQWATDLQLAPCLPSITRMTQRANALEAVLGALYLSTIDTTDPHSGNFSLILGWLYPLFVPLAERVLADPTRFNYKAALQEWSQHYLKELPDYQLSQESPFLCTVYLKGHQRGVGTGPTKKQAQQQAALAAYQALPTILRPLVFLDTPAQHQALIEYQGTID
ncbi:ribonuclease III family protein [Candidatus Cyanaurora vandensis]|uniref:ribonuclease III family protein n=1 Tax=Candidatus Cyanaurora vandensis TaxID=2714958 RepID=UPI00257B95F9|nr:ribonuclease III domain-containing protein [Candidatus Cyanaurora vandensis]